MDKETKRIDFTEHLPQAIWDAILFFCRALIEHWPWTLALIGIIALKVYVDRRFPERRRRRR